MRVLGALIALLPFAFALLRWHSTGSDVRYVWIALAATLCAAAVLVRPRSPVGVRLGRGGVAILAATVGAAVVAILLGATAVSGVALVALGFGGCSAVGLWLVVRS